MSNNSIHNHVYPCHGHLLAIVPVQCCMLTVNYLKLVAMLNFMSTFPLVHNIAACTCVYMYISIMYTTCTCSMNCCSRDYSVSGLKINYHKTDMNSNRRCTHSDEHKKDKVT